MLKKLILGLLALFLLAGGGILFFLSTLAPAQEEYISYDKEKQIALIDKQLEGIDLEKVRKKEKLIKEKSIDEIQNSIAKNELTYTELTAFYLDRIKTYDAGAKGINAVSEINPKAIEEAKAHDLKKDTPKGVSGIPVLIKDNVNTNTLPTSGGAYALKDFTPKNNADLVDALQKYGAILLGKSNLSEMANFMARKMPSGYSSKTGQTHNPFDPIELSPEGSSSGSGAALAANFASIAIGTETTGSIIAPSAVHSLAGFKPTKDSISTKGILPLSSTMDTAGAMAKNVKDALRLYNASLSDPKKEISDHLDENFIKGKRIGLVSGNQDQLLEEKLKTAGAEVVAISLDEKNIDNGFIIDQDFKKDLNKYLKENNAPVKSLEELIRFNEKDLKRRAKYGQDLIESANDVKDFDRKKVDSMVKDAKTRLNKTLDENKLDAIVFLNNDGVLLPSVAGFPEFTVPAGITEKGTPAGATFVTKEKEDEKILNLAYSFEQKTKARVVPERYLKDRE